MWKYIISCFNKGDTNSPEDPVCPSLDTEHLEQEEKVVEEKPVIDYELVRKLQEEGKILKTRIRKHKLGTGEVFYEGQVFGIDKYGDPLKEDWVHVLLFESYSIITRNYYTQEKTLEEQKNFIDDFIRKQLATVTLEEEIIGYP